MAGQVRGAHRRTKLIIDPADSENRGQWLAAVASGICRGVGTSGWLQLEEEKNKFVQRWFVLSSGKLELFPTAVCGREDRFLLVPLDVVTVRRPKSKRPTAEFSFRQR